MSPRRAIAGAVFLALWAAACGVKAPPRPPSEPAAGTSTATSATGR